MTEEERERLEERQKLEDRRERRKRRLLPEATTRLAAFGVEGESPPPAALQSNESGPNDESRFQNVSRGVQFILLFPLAFWTAWRSEMEYQACWGTKLERSLVTPAFVEGYSGLSIFLWTELFFGILINRKSILNKLFQRVSAHESASLSRILGLPPVVELLLSCAAPILSVAAFLVNLLRDFTVFLLMYQLSKVAINVTL